MTTYAPPTSATGRWMTLQEVARESGLREDLVSRFVPHMDTPTGPLYSAHHLGIARLVKQLTEMRLPYEAIDVTVRDAVNRPDAQFGIALAQVRPNTSTRRKLWTVAGAAAAVALIVGGVIGGLISYGNGGGDTTAAPAVTVTAEAPPPAQISATIPATPDPVCAEWGPLHDSYRAKLTDWVKVDPRVPAAQWSAEQRAINMAVIPTLEAEAADMRRLAGQAEDPFLAGLLRAQAEYEELTAQAIPNYEPSDAKFWGATVNFSNAVNARCTAVAPR